MIPLLAVALSACTKPALAPLFARASGLAAGTEDAVAAVNELGSYPGEEADGMLLQIIEGKTELISNQVQEAAIHAAASRDVAGLGATLARKLAPHESIGIRELAASTLLEINCDGVCVEAVLYYLEQNSRGVENLEDWLSARTSEKTQSTMRARQRDFG